MSKGVGAFQSGSGKSILTDGENEGQIKSDGSVKVIESDTAVEPGPGVVLKFNAQEELIFIEKTIGTTKQRKRVLDTAYVGGIELSDVTRTVTLTKYDIV